MVGLLKGERFSTNVASVWGLSWNLDRTTNKIITVFIFCFYFLSPFISISFLFLSYSLYFFSLLLSFCLSFNSEANILPNLKSFSFFLACSNIHILLRSFINGPLPSKQRSTQHNKFEPYLGRLWKEVVHHDPGKVLFKNIL